MVVVGSGYIRDYMSFALLEIMVNRLWVRVVIRVSDYRVKLVRGNRELRV